MADRWYTWEMQRLDNQLWSFAPRLEYGNDPRGYDNSDLSAEEFAHALVTRFRHIDGYWRIAVWDTTGVGRPPVATVSCYGPAVRAAEEELRRRQASRG